ncbi:YcfL family protein [Candidatus Accumulibacter contiguus]|uniref:DUF1425 domain-containing protein n=3 Tax=Candidatus Accumulibacter TaxID=327159 RepID=A0ABX1TGU4_9PROT|nr:DUF1425 domain-containing protein [Candidatus Accumulibacter contiguus]
MDSVTESNVERYSIPCGPTERLSMYSKRRITVAALSLIVLSTLSVAAPASGLISSKVELTTSNDNVQVTDLRAVQSDRLLRVQAELTNFSPYNQQVYYRFKWLDKNGFTVWDDEPWKPMIVYGSQRQIINVSPPSLFATDFRLVLHSSQR